MKRVFYVVILAFAVCFSGNTQVTSVQQAQSLFIYNFSRLIQWPAGNQTGEFVIGVIGNDKLYNSLNTFVANKKVEVLNRLRGTNSLIITEKKGMINMGSAIDFFMDDDKLKFVINSQNAQKYNLIVSKSLEDMAYRN
jgi:hypothetical protein